MHPYDVITIGGATLDIFLHIHDGNKDCCVKKDEENEWFCVKQGSKVSVDTLTYGVGGNAANVAVGLARLGIKTATHIHYGGDELSQKIATTLEKEGVGTEYIVQDPHATSPIGIAINFQSERTLFVHHITRDHTLPDIAVPQWIYLTSVGERWEELYQQVVVFVKKNKVKLAFNPGTHQLEHGVGSFMEQVKAADILFVNKEEAEAIAKGTTGSKSTTGTTGREDLKLLLQTLQGMGPGIVSITDGAHGSFAIDEKGVMYALPPSNATPIERTGAGDAYASGFLGSIIAGRTVNDAMVWGALNATSVIGQIGAETGLLTRDAMLAKFSSTDSTLTVRTL